VAIEAVPPPSPGPPPVRI